MNRLGIAIECILIGMIVGGVTVFEIDHRTVEKTTNAATVSLGVWFSPNGGCTEQVVSEIDKAKTSIHCQAYSFTSKPIAQALLRANSRGVKVIAVLDKSDLTGQGSVLRLLEQNGIETLIDDKHAIAHNKIMLIDDTTIITGSFNFTTSAEKSNSENLLVIRGDTELYGLYEQNFRKHLGHSRQDKN